MPNAVPSSKVEVVPLVQQFQFLQAQRSFWTGLKTGRRVVKLEILFAVFVGAAISGHVDNGKASNRSVEQSTAEVRR